MAINSSGPGNPSILAADAVKQIQSADAAKSPSSAQRSDAQTDKMERIRSKSLWKKDFDMEVGPQPEADKPEADKPTRFGKLLDRLKQRITKIGGKPAPEAGKPTHKDGQLNPLAARDFDMEVGPIPECDIPIKGEKPSTLDKGEKSSTLDRIAKKCSEFFHPGKAKIVELQKNLEARIGRINEQLEKAKEIGEKIGYLKVHVPEEDVKEGNLAQVRGIRILSSFKDGLSSLKTAMTSATHKFRENAHLKLGEALGELHKLQALAKHPEVSEEVRKEADKYAKELDNQINMVCDAINQANRGHFSDRESFISRSVDYTPYRSLFLFARMGGTIDTALHAQHDRPSEEYLEKYIDDIIVQGHLLKGFNFIAKGKSQIDSIEENAIKGFESLQDAIKALKDPTASRADAVRLLMDAKSRLEWLKKQADAPSLASHRSHLKQIVAHLERTIRHVNEHYNPLGLTEIEQQLIIELNSIQREDLAIMSPKIKQEEAAQALDRAISTDLGMDDINPVERQRWQGELLLKLKGLALLGPGGPKRNSPEAQRTQAQLTSVIKLIEQNIPQSQQYKVIHFQQMPKAADLAEYSINSLFTSKFSAIGPAQPISKDEAQKLARTAYEMGQSIEQLIIKAEQSGGTIKQFVKQLFNRATDKPLDYLIPAKQQLDNLQKWVDEQRQIPGHESLANAVEQSILAPRRAYFELAIQKRAPFNLSKEDAQLAKNIYNAIYDESDFKAMRAHKEPITLGRVLGVKASSQAEKINVASQVYRILNQLEGQALIDPSLAKNSIKMQQHLAKIQQLKIKLNKLSPEIYNMVLEGRRSLPLAQEFDKQFGTFSKWAYCFESSKWALRHQTDPRAGEILRDNYRFLKIPFNQLDFKSMTPEQVKEVQQQIPNWKKRISQEAAEGFDIRALIRSPDPSRMRVIAIPGQKIWVGTKDEDAAWKKLTEMLDQPQEMFEKEVISKRASGIELTLGQAKAHVISQMIMADPLMQRAILRKQLILHFDPNLQLAEETTLYKQLSIIPQFTYSPMLQEAAEAIIETIQSPFGWAETAVGEKQQTPSEAAPRVTPKDLQKKGPEAWSRVEKQEEARIRDQSPGLSVDKDRIGVVKVKQAPSKPEVEKKEEASIQPPKVSPAKDRMGVVKDFNIRKENLENILKKKQLIPKDQEVLKKSLKELQEACDEMEQLTELSEASSQAAFEEFQKNAEGILQQLKPLIAEINKQEVLQLCERGILEARQIYISVNANLTYYKQEIYQDQSIAESIDELEKVQKELYALQKSLAMMTDDNMIQTTTKQIEIYRQKTLSLRDQINKILKDQPENLRPVKLTKEEEALKKILLSNSPSESLDKFFNTNEKTNLLHSLVDKQLQLAKQAQVKSKTKGTKSREEIDLDQLIVAIQKEKQIMQLLEPRLQIIQAVAQFRAVDIHKEVMDNTKIQSTFPQISISPLPTTLEKLLLLAANKKIRESIEKPVTALEQRLNQIKISLDNLKNDLTSFGKLIKYEKLVIEYENLMKEYAAYAKKSDLTNLEDHIIREQDIPRGLVRDIAPFSEYREKLEKADQMGHFDKFQITHFDKLSPKEKQEVAKKIQDAPKEEIAGLTEEISKLPDAVKQEIIRYGVEHEARFNADSFLRKPSVCKKLLVQNIKIEARQKILQGLYRLPEHMKKEDQLANLTTEQQAALKLISEGIFLEICQKASTLVTPEKAKMNEAFYKGYRAARKSHEEAMNAIINQFFLGSINPAIKTPPKDAEVNPASEKDRGVVAHILQGIANVHHSRSPDMQFGDVLVDEMNNLKKDSPKYNLFQALVGKKPEELAEETERELQTPVQEEQEHKKEMQ